MFGNGMGAEGWVWGGVCDCARILSLENVWISMFVIRKIDKNWNSQNLYLEKLCEIPKIPYLAKLRWFCICRCRRIEKHCAPEALEPAKPGAPVLATIPIGPNRAQVYCAPAGACEREVKQVGRARTGWEPKIKVPRRILRRKQLFCRNGEISNQSTNQSTPKVPPKY